MTRPNSVDAASLHPIVPRPLEHWGVDVRVNGEDVLTIESNCLFGKSDLSDVDKEAIRLAGKHLLAFIGEEN